MLIIIFILMIIITIQKKKRNINNLIKFWQTWYYFSYYYSISMWIWWKVKEKKIFTEMVSHHDVYREIFTQEKFIVNKTWMWILSFNCVHLIVCLFIWLNKWGEKNFPKITTYLRLSSLTSSLQFKLIIINVIGLDEGGKYYQFELNFIHMFTLDYDWWLNDESLLPQGCQLF